MIDGAGLEGPRRLSPPQLTPPEKSCFQSNKSVDGRALDYFVPSTSCRSRTSGSAVQCRLLYCRLSQCQRQRSPSCAFSPKHGARSPVERQPGATFGPMTLRVRTKTSFAASINVRGPGAYPISNLEPAAAVLCPTPGFPHSPRPPHLFPLPVRHHPHPRPL